MATIRVSHNGCDDGMTVTQADITAMVRSDNAAGSYRFCCPTCQQIVLKDAKPQVIELLVTSGVKLVTIDPPEELDERKALLEDGRSAVDEDDLIDFHRMLKGTTDVISLLDPKEFLEAYDEQVTDMRLTDALVELEDLAEGHGLDISDLLDDLRERFTLPHEQPPEGDFRADGPGDIKNV